MITIVASLSTDETPSKAASSTLTIEAVEYFDSELVVGTTYELASSVTGSSGATQMRTLLYNESETAEMVVRCDMNGTDYVFFPLPPLGLFWAPPSIQTTPMAAAELVVNVHVRTLSGTGAIRIITFFSE